MAGRATAYARGVETIGQSTECIETALHVSQLSGSQASLLV